MKQVAIILIIAASVSCLPAAPLDPNSPVSKDRRETAEHLGNQGTEAIPQLTKFLADSDPTVRLEAVKSIIKIDTEQSLAPLIQATNDNTAEVQIWATAGLVNFYLPGYVQTGFRGSLRRAETSFKSLFTDTDDQVIDAFVVPKPEVIQALGRLVRGGASMDSRAAAARALGILRGKAAVEDLIQAIFSKDTQVMYECLIALQKIGDASAGPKVMFLMNDPDKRVRLAAIETAGLLRNKEALPQLRDILRRSGNKDVRRAALSSIAMVADPADHDLFRRYLDNKDAGLRAAAAEGLGRLGNPGDLGLLENAFENEEKNDARVSIAFSLVMLGKVEISELSPLQYLVNTLNSSARAGLAAPLLTEAARKPIVLRALEKVVFQGTRDEKIYLAQVFGRSGDKNTVTVLEKLSHDPDLKVAERALRAFQSLSARFP